MVSKNWLRRHAPAEYHKASSTHLLGVHACPHHGRHILPTAAPPYRLACLPCCTQQSNLHALWDAFTFQGLERLCQCATPSQEDPADLPHMQTFAPAACPAEFLTRPAPQRKGQTGCSPLPAVLHACTEPCSLLAALLHGPSYIQRCISSFCAAHAGSFPCPLYLPATGQSSRLLQSRCAKQPHCTIGLQTLAAMHATHAAPTLQHLQVPTCACCA